MKKISIALLLFVMVFGSLAACSSSGSDGSNSSGDSQSAQKSKNPKDVSGEITVWSWTAAADALKKMIPDFNKKYPNVKVSLQKMSNDQVYKKLTTGLASGGSGLPDVISIEDNQMANYTTNFPDGFMNLSKMGFDKFENKFTDVKVDTCKDKKGNFLCAPWDGGPVGVFYRTDLFKKANVDPSSIQTWDDFIKAGEKIKNATGVKMLSLNGQGGDDGLFRIMLNEQGTYYFNKKGDISLDSPKAVKAMSVLDKLNKKGLVTKVKNWNDNIVAMKHGDFATYPEGSWWRGTMESQAKEMSGKWGVFPLPAFEKRGNHGAKNGGTNLAIPSSSKNQAAAYAFTKFITTNKKMQMKAFKSGAGYPSLVTAYNNPYFKKEVKYFNNQKIFSIFSEASKDIPPLNYTSDFAAAKKISSNTMASVLNGKSPKDALKDATKQLAQKTKRNTNNK